ncbi:MAG: putative LPS assembly protein LptD, partial [Nitrospinaceae bacterium]
MPIGYIPIGYVPLDNERKSGFLTPSFTVSNVEGVTIGNRFFWAISPHQDATFGLDYIENRGVQGKIEYRYIPRQDIQGQVNASFLKDDLTGNTFWKVDAFHAQTLPLGFQLNAKLDLTSDANFNKIFRNQTENRTRRSSDSFASIFKSWGNQSLDLLARFRESEEENRDDT